MLGSMILRYLPLLFEDPLAFLVIIAAFAVSIMLGLIFHEYCHGWVANRLEIGRAHV